MKASALKNKPVVNQERTVIGSVEDLELDEQDGRMTALLVHRGGVLGTGGAHEAVPASAIRGVGPNLIAVDTTTPVASEGKTT